MFFVKQIVSSFFQKMPKLDDSNFEQQFLCLGLSSDEWIKISYDGRYTLDDPRQQEGLTMRNTMMKHLNECPKD